MSYLFRIHVRIWLWMLRVDERAKYELFRSRAMRR